MTARARIVLLGGHGKIALLTAPKLAELGYHVDAVIRNQDHANDVRAAQAHEVLFDMEQSQTADFVSLFSGADAVVFSAGAGGGNPERTRAVDFTAATKSVDAALTAGVERFVMVSYSRAAVDVERLSRDDPFFPYAQAKHDADEYLRVSELGYTILGPGLLTDTAASGNIQLADAAGDVSGLDSADRVTSRGNVAQAIAHVLRTGAGMKRTVNFFDGDTPIAEAIAQ